MNSEQTFELTSFGEDCLAQAGDAGGEEGNATREERGLTAGEPGGGAEPRGPLEPPSMSVARPVQLFVKSRESVLNYQQY